jgi:hypothetical protein
LLSAIGFQHGQSIKAKNARLDRCFFQSSACRCTSAISALREFKLQRSLEVPQDHAHRANF